MPPCARKSAVLRSSCSFFSQLPAAPRHCKALSKLWAREPHICLGCRVNLDNHHTPPYVRAPLRHLLGTPKHGRAAVRRAPGTPAAAWVPRTTHSTASQALTPQEAHGRRSSNGRQGAGQPVRPPGTEHPPRAIPAAHEVKHLDHLVSRSSYRVKFLLQLPKRVPAPSFSTGLALSSVDSQRRQGTQGTR